MSDLYNRQESLGLNTDISISIIGVGGIGYWVAKFAAMSGITKMYLFDPDTIEESNLARLDLPYDVIGVNKAQVAKTVINRLRPETSVIVMPFILQEHTFTKCDFLVDCTDRTKSQEDNQNIAKKFGVKYIKAGYNGEHITIANSVAEWGESVDGYTVTPSWVVPAVTVAALTVGKIMKYVDKEISIDLKGMYN
jgi:tRNA A37 threonylcarbamoyladenosine dehydratase